MAVELADVIAFLALLVSIYALYQNHKTNQRQARLVEMEIKLNQFLIQKEEDDFFSKQTADIKARYFKIGSNNYRLRIWNDGLGEARNVSLSFANTYLIPLLQDEVDSKFPLNLDSKQSVTLLASVSYDTPTKHSIQVSWDDDVKNGNSKELTLTL
ncbi:hypothetical protein [Acinetobacter sp. BHS4]|uniref:hypothetical protein n=1 Tax=Acinetobacter sp. BHS4 TaxID=2836181 RepID=UPI001BCD0CFD|nr:hypothetical protein [Acinetobacter sp. BHS4]QVR68984.1 hypothetical protein KIP84_05310 [Acinetobacter sp. BHS4]